MKKENIEKDPPKGDIKFSISLSEEQKEAKEIIITKPFNFVQGGAGSGKTLLAVQIALDMLFKRKVNKIVITRPTVSTENNGFIPGSDKEKLEPWLVPIIDNIYKVYNKPDIINKRIEKNEIEIVPISYFRGRTFDNAVCIVDEYQNLTKSQLQMCIGRLGKNSIMIFTGDPAQIDLKIKSFSAVNELSKIEGSNWVSIHTLKENHRHEALAEILKLLNGE